MKIDWKVKPTTTNYVFSTIGVLIGSVVVHYIPRILEHRRVVRETRQRIENTKIVVLGDAEGPPIDIATKKYKEGK